MQRSHSVAERLETAREILSYLLDYSGAQDTLDGIVEWWLLERHIRHGISRVKEALADLVTKGLVIEHKDPNVPVRYGIDGKKVPEIRAIVDRAGGQTTHPVRRDRRKTGTSL